MSDHEPNLKIKGRAISQGLAIGRVFVYHERLETLAGAGAIEGHQVSKELRRMDQAAEAVAGDLRLSAQRIEADTNAKLGTIFEAHEAILLDPGLRQEVRDLIKEEMISAASALSRVFRRRERKFREMSEPAHRRMADDVADLGRRLLREVAGVKTSSVEKMPPGRVLVARRLLPSDTVALPRRAVIGIVVEFGGHGSHAALLAEAMGIPTVAQIPNVTERVADGELMIVDGFRGEVWINPDEATERRYIEEIAIVETKIHEAKVLARAPARTSCGVAVTVLANVGCREDVSEAAENGADGVGLHRLEQFYLGRKTPPSDEELLGELRAMFAPLKEKVITVRLLDLGGDKPLPFLKLPPEDNPFLGQRGVRFLLRFPDLLDTQLRALCQLSQEQDVRILVPMVTLAEDMAQVRGRLVAAAKATGGHQLPALGAMIETPAAALSVPVILEQADFLSIGTNDLTQYTMAAGRENPLVNDYFLQDHPAVLRLVGMIVEEAARVPVAICGELARQLDAIPALLKLGIRILSVAPPLVPGVKDAVRHCAL